MMLAHEVSSASGMIRVTSTCYVVNSVVRIGTTISSSQKTAGAACSDLNLADVFVRPHLGQRGTVHRSAHSVQPTVARKNKSEGL